MPIVLAHYGVQLIRNASSLRGNCPLPSHTSKTKDTFYVNEEKNVWYSHSDSCKKNGSRGGNVIDFVAVKAAPIVERLKRNRKILKARLME